VYESGPNRVVKRYRTGNTKRESRRFTWSCWH